MLNRTPGFPPGTAPTADDLAAEDRRIEVAAARETALALSLRINAGRNLDSTLINARQFERFLLDHQTNGQQALETAIAYGKQMECSLDPVERSALYILAAERFCYYLDTGRPDAA